MFGILPNKDAMDIVRRSQDIKTRIKFLEEQDKLQDRFNEKTKELVKELMDRTESIRDAIWTIREMVDQMESDKKLTDEVISRLILQKLAETNTAEGITEKVISYAKENDLYYEGMEKGFSSFVSNSLSKEDIKVKEKKEKKIKPLISCPVCKKMVKGNVGLVQHTRFNHSK